MEISLLELESNSDQSTTCRICFEQEPDQLLFQPCKCDGSQKFIHTTCLNEWRITSPEASSKCFTCLHEYQILQVRPPLTTRICLTFSDSVCCIPFYVITIGILGGLSVLLMELDVDRKLINFFDNHLNPFQKFPEKSLILIYYLLVSYLSMISICLIFMFNLMVVKNPNLYLTYLFGHPRRIGITRIIFLVVMTFFMLTLNMFIGSLFVTSLAHGLLRHHYTYVLRNFEINSNQVLPYEEEDSLDGSLDTSSSIGP